MKKITISLSILLMGFFLGITIKSSGQTTIWSEDFSAYVTNTGIEGPGAVNIGDYPAGVTKWTLDVSACTLSDADDYIKTRYETMYTRDLDGYAIWQSESIDISAYSGATFSLYASESGGMETSDYFDVYYKIDNGAFTLIPNWNGLGSVNHTLIDDFDYTTITQSTPSGYSLLIKVVMANNTSSEYHKLDDVEVYGNMGYASSTTVQNTDKIAPGRTNNNVIAIEIETTGSGSPMSISSFTVNANGSTTPVSNNIENAKIYYTGTDNTFATDTQFGSTYTSPTTTNFDIADTQELMEGTNYFWLTFDTKAGATNGDVVDAECISFVIAGSTETPTITAPAGSRTIVAPLSGNYTIGAAGDYTSFANAANDLNNLGISGSVSFTVETDTYTEQILLSAIAGTSATDTIIFQSNSGNRADVILQYEPASDPANYILKFDGTDYITFQNMTLKNTGTSSYGRVVVFAGATNNINLTGCNITGRDVNNDSYDYTVITGESGTSNMASDITFNNDTIRYGSYGIYFSGGDDNNLETGIRINNSVFEDFYYAGIFLFYQDSIVVHSNKLTGKGVYEYEYGMFLMYCYGGYEITANMVFLSAEDVNTGIRLLECHASAARYALVANNYFSQEASATGGAYGIDVSDCSYQKIYHNSINMRTSAKSGSGGKFYATVGCYFNCPTIGDYGFIDLLNNIIKSSKKAISVSESAVSKSYLEESNNNDWFTLDNILGSWGSTDCADLTEWQTVSGMDGSSVSEDPEYVSSEVPDINNENLYETVPLTTEVIKDIYKVTRNDPTTPGAVEESASGGQIVWTGNEDDNWNNPNNWDPPQVPTKDYDVWIQGNNPNNRYPTLNSGENGECNNLIVDDGAQLTLDGQLEVNGNVQDIGTINNELGFEGGLSFTGDQNTTITTNSSSSPNIEVNKASGSEVKCESEVIVDNFKITSGTWNGNFYDILIKGYADLENGNLTNDNKISFTGAGNSTVEFNDSYRYNHIETNKDLSTVEVIMTPRSKIYKFKNFKVINGKVVANGNEVDITGDADFSGGELNTDKITYSGSSNSAVTPGDERQDNVVVDKENPYEVQITPTGKKYKIKAFTIERGTVIAAVTGPFDISGDADLAGGSFNADVTFSGTTNSQLTTGSNIMQEVVVDKDGAELSLYDALVAEALKILNGSLDANNKKIEASGNVDFSGGTITNTSEVELTSNSSVQFNPGNNTINKLSFTGGGTYDMLAEMIVKSDFFANGTVNANGNDFKFGGDVDLSNCNYNHGNGKVILNGDGDQDIWTGMSSFFFMQFNSITFNGKTTRIFTPNDAHVIVSELIQIVTSSILKSKSISDTVKFYGNVQCNNDLTIGTPDTGGVVVNVMPGYNLTVNGNTTINNSGSLVLKSDSTGMASFINNGNITCVGNFTTEQHFIGEERHFISSPVSGATAVMFSDENLQYHSETDNSWTEIVDPAFALATMQGFAMWSEIPGDNIAEFTGPPNSGEQNFNFSYAGSTPVGDYGWNLIGNPYTATLDWDQVTIPANLDGTIYLFDPSIGEHGDYVYYLKGAGSNTATQYVALAQGFFVHCNNTAGGILTFTGGEMVANEATFYKSTEQAENSLILEVAGHESSKAEIRFLEGATPDFDGNYDVYKLFSESRDVPHIYSATASGKLAINTLPSIENHNLVTVGFKVGIVGDYTISFSGIENFDPSVPLYLHDTKEDIITDIRQNNQYSFFYDTLDANNRFVVCFTEGTTTTQTISLAEGWGGWSSYNSPDWKSSMEEVMAPVLNDMIITQYFNEIFYPLYGINTMGNFSNAHGYISKMSATADLPNTGIFANPTIQLNQGWNLIPVINQCDVDVTLLGELPELIIAHEIGGGGIYYPEYGINTISNMVPGAAYYVKVDADTDFTFPACADASTTSAHKPLRLENNTPWNKTNYTGISHSVVFEENAISLLKQGDVIGAFTQSGLCAGIVNVTPGAAAGLNIFGNDNTTSAIDGYTDGEPLNFKVFNPGCATEYELVVVYDPSSPNANGLFSVNGLSIINNLTMNVSDVTAHTLSNLNIYPNPSNGIFNITGNSLNQDIKVVVFNAHGQIVYQDKLIEPHKVDISHQPRGVYFVKFICNTALKIEKVIVE